MPWGPVIQLMTGLTGGCASSRLSASANPALLHGARDDEASPAC